MSDNRLPPLDVTLRSGDVLIMRSDGSYTVHYAAMREMDYEVTPIYDDLEAAWPEIQRQAREAKMRASMTNVGKAFRNMAGLITAMSDGLKDGLSMEEKDNG